MDIVIFDMDGTLLDSAKDITISINEVRKKNHGLNALDEAFVVEAINREHRNLCELFYGTKNYEKQDKDYFEEHYNDQCIQNVSLYDEVFEVLNELRRQKVRLSVATNAPTKFACKMLQSCNVFECFDFIVGADRVSKAKPDKEMLEYILTNYGYKPEHKALMVGDNSKDMMAAKHAGIEGAFATWGFSPNTDYHKILTSPRDVLSLLD